MNTANFINVYMQIYVPNLYVTRITQNKIDSVNSILQHGRFVDSSYCVVFHTSRFPHLILSPRYCKWKVATTYLAISTKGN